MPLGPTNESGTLLEVVLDDSAYIFEGKLYVRYRLSNKTGEEVTYTEPRIILRGGEKDRAVTASIMTSRGDFVVPAGESAYGVAVFERPTLEKGERLYFFVKLDGAERGSYIRLLEQS